MKGLRIFNDRDPAEKRWVTLAYILLTMTMLCGVVSIMFFINRERTLATQRENARIAVRDESRYVLCVNFNIEQSGDRASALNIVLVGLGFAEPGPLSDVDRQIIVNGLPPETQVRYLKVERQVDLDNPYQNCSPEAIKQHYLESTNDPGAGASP